MKRAYSIDTSSASDAIEEKETEYDDQESQQNKRMKLTDTYTTAAAPPLSSSATTTMKVADQTVQVRPMKSFLCTATSLSSPSTIHSWRRSFQQDGYLYLRDLLPRNDVLKARKKIVEVLKERGLIRRDEHEMDVESTSVGSDSVATSSSTSSLPSTSYPHSIAVDPAISPNLLSDMTLQNDPLIVNVLEHEELWRMFERLLDEDDEKEKDADVEERKEEESTASPITPSSSSLTAASSSTSSSSSPSLIAWTSRYKWLRGVSRGCCTGFHLDSVYMQSHDDHASSASSAASSSSSSSSLYSLWMPLGDLTPAHGALIVSPGSHRNEQFACLRSEYGRTRIGAASHGGNGTTSGWIDVSSYTNDPVDYVTSGEIEAGSAILIHLQVLHGTSINTSQEYRLSCDTRWTVTKQSERTKPAKDGDEEENENCQLMPPRASIQFKRPHTRT